MRCTQCNSAKVGTNGFTSFGTQRYRCRDCDFSWTEATLKKAEGAKCPHCGEHHTVKNGIKRRKRLEDFQLWKCKSCGFSFRTTLEGSTYRKELGAVCPKCEGCCTVRNGTTPLKQVWLCRHCKSSFSTRMSA